MSILIVIILVVLIVVASALVQTVFLRSSSSSSSASTSTSIRSTTLSTTASTSRLSTSSVTTTTTTTSPCPCPTNNSALVDDSWTAPYDSLDPQSGFLTTDGFFANVFQGLVQFNGSDSNHVVPSIASNWSASEDFKHWTFAIRSGVIFSNGDPVNAYTGWFSWQRGYLLNAPLGTYVSNYPNLLENVSNPCGGSGPASCSDEEGNPHNPFNPMIWGTRAAIANVFGVPVSNENAVVSDMLDVLDHFNPANASQLAVMEDPDQGVQVINSHTLRFNLLQGYTSFQLILPPQWGSFVDPTWIDNPSNCGGVVNNTACGNFSTKGGPGTGPYEYGTIGPSNTFVVLTANPDYWAEGLNESQLCSQPGDKVCAPVLEAPHIRAITMNFGSEAPSVINDFGTNKAQLAVVGINDFDNLLGNYSYPLGFNELFRGLGYPLGDLGVGLNGNVFPTNITDFRLAVVHAINYSAFVSKWYDYHGVPLAELFQPPAPPGWGPLDNPGMIQLYSYNYTLAAQYLNRSGWEGNFFTLTTAAVGQIPENTTLGNPAGQRLGSIDYYYIVPLTPFQSTEDAIISGGLSRIGINVDFIGWTGCSFYPCQPNSNLWGAGWYADWPDPILQEFQPLADPTFPNGAFPNGSLIGNSTLLALLHRIPGETNPVQATSDSAKAWMIYAQLAEMIQLPLPENYVFAQPYVQGIVYNSFQFSYYYNMMYYQSA